MREFLKIKTIKNISFFSLYSKTNPHPCTLESFIPARCWMAPEIPTAM